VFNIGLSQRANHPAEKLHLLHGSLFDVRCTEFYCDYAEKDNFTDPIVPALAIPIAGPHPSPAPASTDRTGTGAAQAVASPSLAPTHPPPGTDLELDLSSPSTPLPALRTADLPHCPKCTTGLLRPGVVWFGEMLPSDTVAAIDAFIAAAPRIDLMLVIGTSAVVYPAAGYVERARRKGARVAVVNVDRSAGVGVGVGGGGRGGEGSGDWFFEGDAGGVVPVILGGVVGGVGDGGG